MPDNSPKPKPARQPRKPGRKPTPITLAQVESCGKLGMTQSEVGDFFGLNQSTISRRFASDEAFAQAYRKGRATLCRKLRAAQIRAALQGNVVAQIWMGKNLLRQTDRTETHDVHDVNVQHTFIARWGGNPGELAAAPQPDALADPDGSDTIDGELDDDV